MDDVIEQAKKLAETLASNERMRELRDAIAAVDADPEASRTQQAYAAAADALHRREEAGQPIEPEQKRAFATAAEAVRRSPILVRMLRAHQAYAEMMEAVQHIVFGTGEAEVEGGEAGHEHGPGCSHDAEGHGAPAKRDEEPPQKSVLWTP